MYGMSQLFDDHKLFPSLNQGKQRQDIVKLNGRCGQLLTKWKRSKTYLSYVVNERLQLVIQQQQTPQTYW